MVVTGSSSCAKVIEILEIRIWIVVFLWNLAAVGSVELSPRVIVTKQNQFQGILGPTHLRSHPFSSGQYRVEIFKGIPYASPPVGPLRFERPAPIPLLSTKIFIANESKPACPQHFETLNVYMGPDKFRKIKSSLNEGALEDCLYLDIYAPIISQQTKSGPGLPVLVYANSHVEDPEDPFDGSSVAAIGNLIVVSFRYRVGILGYLHPGYSEDIRGNFGLWDQLAALHWIRENIGGFGGDENNISLMGFDLDAAFAGILALSPFSEAHGGLFRRLILLNGSPLSPLSINHRPLATTTQVARTLTCPIPEMSGELGRCLRHRQLDQLLGAAHSIGFPLFNNHFAPSVDGTMVKDVIGNANSIYADNEAIRDLLSRYDILCGLTEGTILPNIGQPSSLWQNLDLDDFVTAVLKLALQLEAGSEPKDSLRQELKRELIREYGDPYPYIRDILADFLTVYPMTNLLNLHSQTGRNTFFYVSKHYNPLGKAKNNDISYIFTSSVYEWKYIHHGHTKIDLSPYDLLITYISNFVRSGDPNIQYPHDHYSGTPRTWKKYSADKGHFLRFGREVVEESKYRGSTMEFWFHVFPAILKNSLTSEQLNEKGPISDSRFPFNFPKPGQPGVPTRPMVPPNSGSQSEEHIITSMMQNTVVMVAAFLLLLNFLCFFALFYQRQRLKRTELHLRRRYMSGQQNPETLPDSPENSQGASGIHQPIPSSSQSEAYGYIRQVPLDQSQRAPRAAMDTMSETETDNGFGADFLGPNYDPRTKVTRWMFQQNRNDGSGGGSFERSEPPEGIPLTSMVPYASGGTLPRGPPHVMTTVLSHAPYYNQPFQPSVPSDIPYADSRATTPSVTNYNYTAQQPPHPAFNNNLSTNNFNNPRRSFVPSPSNSGTTTLSNTDSQNQQHRRSRAFFPLLSANSVIVQEVDLEDFPNGDSELVVTDDLEVQSSRPKLVPVRSTGTLTRSVGVGDTNSVGNGAEVDENLPLLSSITKGQDGNLSPSASSRQGQKVTFADEIL